MSLYSGIAGSGAAIKGIKEHSSFGDFWADYIAGRAIGALYGAVGYGYSTLPGGFKWMFRMTYLMHLAGQGRLEEPHHGYAGMGLSLGSAVAGMFLPGFTGSNLATVTGGILEMDDFLQHVVIQTYIHPGAWRLGKQADNIYPSPIHSGLMWIDEYYGETLPEWIQGLFGL